MSTIVPNKIWNIYVYVKIIQEFKNFIFSKTVQVGCPNVSEITPISYMCLELQRHICNNVLILILISWKRIVKKKSWKTYCIFPTEVFSTCFYLEHIIHHWKSIVISTVIPEKTLQRASNNYGEFLCDEEIAIQFYID